MSAILRRLACDLKTGEVYKGEPKAGTKADTTITIDDSDMVDLVRFSRRRLRLAALKGKLNDSFCRRWVS